MKCRYCPQTAYRRDLCSKHYKRERARGHALAKPQPTPPRNFKGLGVIACAVCGDPVRDHSILEPCI